MNLLHLPESFVINTLYPFFENKMPFVYSQKKFKPLNAHFKDFWYANTNIWYGEFN